MNTSTQLRHRYDAKSLVKSLKTVADFVRFCYSRLNESDVFFGHGNDNAWDEAVHLVLHSLSLPVTLNEQFLHTRLTREERKMLFARICQRIDEHVPNAYLLNEAWFADIPFHVDERVLIPRSPIAELIQNGFDGVTDMERVDKVLDLCTGSGCIGIAIAMYHEHVLVDLADISAGALEVARINQKKHGVEQRVRVIESDLFSGLHEKYDLIVSNPPYVDQHDLQTMPKEYSHEPRIGLEAGEDGLDLVRRMLAEAREYLTDEGILVVEVGNSWRALERAYPSVPFEWIAFERGGGGVFSITARELDACRDEILAGL